MNLQYTIEKNYSLNFAVYKTKYKFAIQNLKNKNLKK